MKMIKFHKPNYSQDAMAGLLEVYGKGELVKGEYIERFEKAFAKWVGVKYAIAVNSGSSALFLAFNYLNIKNKEVILPYLGYLSDLNSILDNGGIPVFAKVDYDDYCIDRSGIEAKKTANTRAILAVHLTGNQKVVRSDLPVIYDSAHTIFKFGSGREVGLMTIYSFYPTKVINMADGGMIATNDYGVYSLIKKSRYLGFDGNGNQVVHGYKMNMSNLNACLGYHQVLELDNIIKCREFIRDYYNLRLGLNRQSLGMYVIKMPYAHKFVKYMADNGVEVIRHFRPLNRFIRQDDIDSWTGLDLVSLPFYPSLQPMEWETICDLITNFKNYELPKIGHSSARD